MEQQVVEYNKELTELLSLVDSFVNENRLANVVSHRRSPYAGRPWQVIKRDVV